MGDLTRDDKQRTRNPQLPDVETSPRPSGCASIMTLGSAMLSWSQTAVNTKPQVRPFSTVGVASSQGGVW